MSELEIYPEAIWTRASSQEASPFEYLFQHFEALQTFVSAAASHGDGVVVFLT
jgi:hypothetical protein